ncbi:hypothetical protein SUDANB145_07287 (plasmid) [Streptomyces sp. enrichment culture]|uniref:hypothetical protein n=1 Tax=Streptomyces sp. enrichment culture TaxID=1795815 RepID=UPI003F56E92F
MSLSPAARAETAADLNALPHARITSQGSEARVFTAGLDDLTAWWLALGGQLTVTPAPHGSGVVLWTLHTRTDPTNTDSTIVRVHALALDTDPLDADCAPALTDAA